MATLLLSAPPLMIRPSTCADAGRVQDFVAALSPETAYRRFLAPVPRLTAAHAAAMVCVDHDRDETLLAEVHDGVDRTLVGIAQYVGTGPQVAEMAIVIADAWQQRGVGTTLLRRLVDTAAARSVTTLTGDYLSENKAILRLAQRMPGELTLSADGPTSIMALRLAPETGGATVTLAA